MRCGIPVVGRIAPVLGVLAGGCGSNSLSLPALPASPLGAEEAAVFVTPGPPVDVYARVAKGALKCWFGTEGSLKKTHVFHAKVDPPSAGGAAEIVVHTRDVEPGAAGYAALRSYRIGITTSGDGSLVEVENVRFPEAQGADMNRDVARWAKGEEGCSVIGTGGWNAGPPPPAAVAPKAVGTGSRAGPERR